MTLFLGAALSSQDMQILQAKLEDRVHTKIEASQALLPQVAKYSSAYGDLAAEFGDLLNQETELQNALNRGLDAGEVAAWESGISRLSDKLDDFQLRLTQSLRSGVSSRETGAVLWTTATLIGVGIAGWYVLKGRKN